MTVNDSHRGELDVVRPGDREMDPTSKSLLDLWRDEIAAIEHQHEAQLTSNSILMTIYGLLLGLVIGFLLGASTHPVLVSGM